MRTVSLVAVAAAFCTSCGRAPAVPPPPNVLLITIDTLRADRLGGAVAPALDRLASSAIRFTAARSAVPLTLPSHTTMLTGQLPPAHGVRVNGERLDDAHATLATLLKSAGYETAAFVGAFVLDRRFGLSRGFDTYDDQIPRDPSATDRLDAERPASVVVDRALAWLNAWSSGSGRAGGPGGSNPSPFFAWIHLYDPHAPYTPPPEFRAHRSPYDGEVAYADSQIARVLDWLHARDLMRRTLVVAAGDHGEGLGDHGERTHGMLLYDSTLRVPLIVAAPGAPPARRDEAVSLSDIAPTILRAAGVAAPANMKGHDLVVPLKPDATYSETEYPRTAGWAPLQALTDGRWKVIRAGSASEVYDVQSDPGEKQNVASEQANAIAARSKQIDALRAASPATAARALSPEAERRLRSLGYVASTASAVDAQAANPAAMIADWNAFEDALSALDAHRPDALSALETLAKRQPNAPVFQSTYARALKEARQLDRALAVYREAAARWPTDAALLHDFAVAAREASAAPDAPARLREEATRAERAATTLAPDSAAAHNGLGLMAVDENRPRDAAAEFQRAAEIDPNNASYWANLGNSRRALGDRAGAEQAYRRALDVDARSADAANGLGVLLIEAQRPAEAVPYLERAAAAPDFFEARLNLGIALQQTGQTARAAATYRAVLAAPPGFARERDAAAKLLASLKIPR